MDLHQIIVIEHEHCKQAGRIVNPPTRKVAACAVIANPFAGRPAEDDLSPLVDLSVEVGTILTERAIRALGAKPTGYGKAAIVGTAGDREHGAAMIHVRLGLAMRRGIGGGPALIPGVEKIAGPGAAIDLVFGGVEDGWDYDAMDAMEISIPGVPKSDEIVLIVGFAVGGRPNARIHGASAEEVAKLVSSLRKNEKPAKA
jgi:hypothetical protein